MSLVSAMDRKYLWFCTGLLGLVFLGQEMIMDWIQPRWRVELKFYIYLNLLNNYWLNTIYLFAISIFQWYWILKTTWVTLLLCCQMSRDIFNAMINNIIIPHHPLVLILFYQFLLCMKNLLQPVKHSIMKAAKHIVTFKGYASLDNASFNWLFRTISNRKCVTGYWSK